MILHALILMQIVKHALKTVKSVLNVLKTNISEHFVIVSVVKGVSKGHAN